MKHTKLRILVILLFTSLLAAKCDCTPNSPKKKEKEKEKERPDKHKQKEVIEVMMKQLGLDKLAKLKEKREYGQKPRKKNKLVGDDLVTQQSNQAKLGQLVKEEKDLVNKAQVALGKLEKDANLLESLFGGGSSNLPIPIDKELMDDLIKDCKDDPKYTEAALDVLQKIQKALDNFQKALPTLRDKKPSLKELVNVLLKSVDVNMEEVKELFGSKFFDQEALQEIEKKLGEPIDPAELSQMSPKQRQVYDQLVNKYPFANKNGWNFFCALFEECLPSFKGAVDVGLDILKNIQGQSQLEEWEE